MARPLSALTMTKFNNTPPGFNEPIQNICAVIRKVNLLLCDRYQHLWDTVVGEGISGTIDIYTQVYYDTS